MPKPTMIDTLLKRAGVFKDYAKTEKQYKQYQKAKERKKDVQAQKLREECIRSQKSAYESIKRIHDAMVATSEAAQKALAETTIEQPMQPESYTDQLKERLDRLEVIADELNRNA
jgi:hypothetical protein